VGGVAGGEAFAGGRERVTDPTPGLAALTFADGFTAGVRSLGIGWTYEGMPEGRVTGAEL